MVIVSCVEIWIGASSSAKCLRRSKNRQAVLGGRVVVWWCTRQCLPGCLWRGIGVSMAERRQVVSGEDDEVKCVRGEESVGVVAEQGRAGICTATASSAEQGRRDRRRQARGKLWPAVVPDNTPRQLGGGEMEIKLLGVQCRSAQHNFASAHPPA